jgi:hypothetical protein
MAESSASGVQARSSTGLLHPSSDSLLVAAAGAELKWLTSVSTEAGGERAGSWRRCGVAGNNYTTTERGSWGGGCRMDLPGPTASVGTSFDYSVGPWDYPACATQHLKAWSTRIT